MAPESRNGFGVFFFFNFLFGAGNGVFAGVFANSGVQNVVFCVVNRGGFVVKTWLEITANPAAKIFHFFEIYFCLPAVNGD
jgi:hypothetical protein